MKQITLTIPSKTFVVGEYLALNGGPALLMMHTPCFEFQLFFTKTKRSFKNNLFHKQSPAAKFLNQHLPHLVGCSMKFTDPHRVKGGYGASSAEFIAAVYLVHLATQEQKVHYPTLQVILDAYQNATRKSDTLLPSGYDVLAQSATLQVSDACNNTTNSKSKLIYINQHSVVDCLAWPFDRLKIKTKRISTSCATHEHLSHLKTINTQPLQIITEQCYDSVHNSNPEIFINSINDYQTSLENLNLQLETTKHLCRQKRNEANVLASKGCGALGADVLLTVENDC